MKWYSLAAVTAFASTVLAEDLLFVTGLTGLEQKEAVGLGFTTKTISETEWRGLKTADFAQYKAIIIGDDYGSSAVSQIKFLGDTKDVWGPAVQGNIIVHGADQSNHGKTVLIDNSIKFAASGKSVQGAQQTGLYLSLSQYYDSVAVANVDALAYFGTFEVRGLLSCYDKVHIVASSPSIDTLTDAYLSNWGCSVHEAFSVYPTTGINGFQAIAIADGVVAPGTQQFGGGHTGLPYIITRGATPAGCGDGQWDSSLGEECDDGNAVDGDGCSKSCKCESGKPKGDGTCFPSNTTTPIGTGTGSKPSGYVPIPSGSIPSASKPSGYTNISSSSNPGGVIPPYPTTTPPYPITTPPPPYVTPGPSSVSCIGVEIIVSVTVTESCSTIAPGSTITYTSTSALSTYQKPIYNTQISTMPCYVCAMSSQGIPTKSIGFITATTTYCPACTAPPPPATIYACPTCSGITLTATLPWASTPAFSNQGAVQYTTYAAMTETKAAGCTTCGAATVTTNPAGCTTCGVATATSSSAFKTVPTGTAVPTGPVQFTGAATKKSGGVMAAVVALAAMVL